jgi:twitching motility protein PilT
MLNEILLAAINTGASDVHLHIGSPPLLRVNKLIQPMEAAEPVSAEYLLRIAKRIMNEKRWKDFEAQRDCNFCYEFSDAGRFRVNAHFQRGAISMSIRLIGKTVPHLENLYLPEVVTRLTKIPRGLVLVTGPAASGKTTTIAAMLETINNRDKGHILTLEDPIEFMLTSRRCLVEQRELGSDVLDIPSGLRNALRQDPDTIFVSELRDVETTTAALMAAESGHLVISTLHTLSAPDTVQRILDMYPESQQHQIRSMLAANLAAVISQTLFRRIDHPSLIPATEVMICEPAVRTCIRENQIEGIARIVDGSRSLGMQSMDSSIKQLFVRNYISREEAAAQMLQPEKLERMPLVAVA